MVGLAVCLVVSSASAGLGQTLPSNPWFARVAFTPSYVLPTNPFLVGENASGRAIRWGPHLTVEAGRQTDGTRPWHQLYGLPSYGVGFSVQSFGNDLEVGRPLSAYTFFSWPFARLSERAQVTTDFGMGVSWNWKEYHPLTNSRNLVLGSDLNAHIDWGFYLRYQTAPRLSLYGGVDFTHRSNGGTRQPDEGINAIGPKVGLRYNFGDEPKPGAVAPLPPFEPAWEFVVGAAGGAKDVLERAGPDIRQNFGAVNVTTGLQRQFYRYGKVAVGSDVTYDGSTGAHLGLLDEGPRLRRADPGQRISAGPYLGYEHVIARLSAIVQTGYAVSRGAPDPAIPRFYQRYGWRYHFTDRVWGTFAIRSSRFRRADFLEIGVGYRWRWATPPDRPAAEPSSRSR